MIDLPKKHPVSQLLDNRGSLSFMNLPFPIKRFYYFSNLTNGAERGNHAHKELRQIILCVQGSFDLNLATPDSSHQYSMSQSDFAVEVPKGYWRFLKNFSLDSIGLVLASESYDESDYIKDFGEYKYWFKKNYL
jgi:hypothetical protein